MPTTLRSRSSNRLVEYALRGLDPEVAHGVEDPQQRHAEVALAALPPALQALEDGIEVAIAEQDHADGDIDLGVQHVFRLQLLHQAIGDELVIFRRAQPVRDAA